MKKLLFIILLLLVPISVKALTVSSEAVILMDQDSGRILYERNLHKQKLIASTTKIMTAVITIESNQLDDMVKVDENILKAYGSSIYISIGEEIKLEDLLYGLMLRSGNDAALAISNYVCGSETKFVERMNEKAAQLGMAETVFYNSNGLDEVNGNLSTTYDMALLTRYANSLNEYRKIVGTKTYTVKTNYKTYVWKNKNKLLRTYKYTTGGKTGFTEKAKRTLVTSATKDDMNLIVVTLNDPDDWNTHKKLYEYAFANYYNYKVLNKENFKINSNYYKDNLYIAHDYNYPILAAEKDKIKVSIKLEKKKNYQDKDKVGEVEVYFKDMLVHEEGIYVNVEVKNNQKNFWQKLKDWF